MSASDNVFLTTARVNSFSACHLVSDEKALGESKLHNHRGTALTSNLINPVKLIFFSSQLDSRHSRLRLYSSYRGPR